jgi:hypothetical protein
MRRARRKHSAKFKAQVALEAIRGEKGQRRERTMCAPFEWHENPSECLGWAALLLMATVVVVVVVFN